MRVNHDAQKAALDAYGISLDLFGGSGLEPARDVHAKLSDELIRRLHERGYLRRRTTRQFFDVRPAPSSTAARSRAAAPCAAASPRRPTPTSATSATS